MIGRILQSGRRQLHTIISRELIKPSSPTPSHLQTYNLSMLDQYNIREYMPLLLMYPNNEINSSLTPDDKAQKMKKALSQSLSRYYPLAGRFQTPTATHIDCNDEGVVFVQAKHDSQLNKFQHMTEEDETVSQLFADRMVWEENSPQTNNLILGVQLNHFACGGMGVAVSMSHRVGDASTLGSYVSYWASVTRYGSLDHKEVEPLNPHYIQSPPTQDSLRPDYSFMDTKNANRATKKFVFPNSRLSDLTNMVIAEGGSTFNINKPTRVEVLTSLLYKTAVTTARSSSFFKPSFLLMPMDIRRKIVPKLPLNTVGNFLGFLLVTTRDTSETSLSMVLSEIKKKKMELERLQSPQLATENYESVLTALVNEDLESATNRCFNSSSVCGFPFNKVDFGWGNPTGASISYRSSDRTGFALMDTIDRDGIQAWVTLDEQHMKIFQNNKEMLSFCQN